MSVLEAMARAIYDTVRSDAMKEADWDEWNKRFFNRQIRAALAEARRHGWQLVPVEPTEKMLGAAWDACRRPTIEIALATTAEQCQRLKAHQRYRAMIAAAPRIEE